MEELRSETARRAIVAAGPDRAQAPMIVAVAALLTASGRLDFSENEIAREVELLAAELRRRIGFTEAERAAGERAWEGIEPILRASVPESTYELWLEPIRPCGLASGRLWLTAPNGILSWSARRYRSLLRDALPDDLEVGLMGYDPGEDGRA